MCCSAEQHKQSERFCAGMRPEGGTMLLTTRFDNLYLVAVKEEGITKSMKAAAMKIKEGRSDAPVWEFIKV